MKKHATPPAQASFETPIYRPTGRLFQPAVLLTFLCLLISSFQVYAHPGHAHDHGFTNGLGHPLSGLDHVIAMIAVGLWAAQLGGRATWLLPLASMGFMAVGGGLGWAGLPWPFVEAGILASVVVLGLLIASAARWSLTAGVILVGTFALFHGQAHGAAMPDTSAKLFYGAGFIIATALLHGCGVGLGILASRLSKATLLRYAGGAVTAIGAWLCFA